MSEPLSSPLGVCVWPPPARNQARPTRYADYIHEILQHAGVCYTAVAPEDLALRLPDLRLLLTVGEITLPDGFRAHLQEWVEAGGAWISVGGLCGAEALFGAERVPPAYSGWAVGVTTLGEGCLQADDVPHPITAHLKVPLRFFNGIAVWAAGAQTLATVLDAHHRPTSRAALLETRAGLGRCLLIAPDITGTIVHIQQGRAITRDGVPAPDGTAPVSDGILKSDDGAVLDWLLDRQPVEALPGLSAFVEPMADQWRELLLRALFYLASEQNVTLPLLWLYPRNLAAVAHMSHDTDNNDVPKAEQMLQTLQTAQIRSTWCTILPGYPPAIIAAIRQAGHELAMHYDALDHPWGEAEFDDQWRRLTEMFDGEAPVTNKNHYLRWEGDTEFFDWCARRGLRIDQSKGASKLGEAGFNFGTCHPFFPLAPDCRTIDMLELATPTQDLNLFVPAAFFPTLLDAVQRHHGVLHLLFHPENLTKPGVQDALLEAVKQARQAGLEWWTAREIDAWERARRQAHWSGFQQTADGAAVRLRVAEGLPDATLLWLSPSATRCAIDGAEHSLQPVTRWGFHFQAAIFSAVPNTDYTLQVQY